jgi:hypothetical protein
VGASAFWSNKAEIVVMPVIIRIDRTILVTAIEICFFLDSIFHNYSTQTIIKYEYFLSLEMFFEIFDYDS